MATQFEFDQTLLPVQHLVVCGFFEIYQVDMAPLASPPLSFLDWPCLPVSPQSQSQSQSPSRTRGPVAPTQAPFTGRRRLVAARRCSPSTGPVVGCELRPRVRSVANRPRCVFPLLPYGHSSSTEFGALIKTCPGRSVQPLLASTESRKLLTSCPPRSILPASRRLLAPSRHRRTTTTATRPPNHHTTASHPRLPTNATARRNARLRP